VTDPEYFKVRVLVDGSEAAPRQVMFDAANDAQGWEANSFQWVRSELGPGTQSVRVQFRWTTTTA
jgi:hypothetical protein